MEYDFAFHNSHVNQYRSPFGAVSIGTKVTLKILVEKGVEAYLHFINLNDEISVIKMTWEGDNENRALFSVQIDTVGLLGINRYFFGLKKDNRYFYYGNNDEALGGEGKICWSNPIPYQLTVYEKSYIPQWFKQGLIYQIFVDRFYNGNENGEIQNRKKNSFIYSNWEDSPMYIKGLNGEIKRWDFYGGNLKGIIKKIPYLKELGVTIIYLNPIFESVSCHKYDTGDYEKIDGMFGNEEDFKELCITAKKEGIRIVLDGVFSHTGADSKYFNKYNNYDSIGAYQSKESPYFNWYSFSEYPNKYEAWWGIENQPNINELNPSYINYMITGENSIVSKWIKLGASGWRLDVADELPDEFIELLKFKMREVNSESILIGEVWEDASNKVSYSTKRRYLYGKELDSVTNFPLRDHLIRFVKGEINAQTFIRRIYSLYENYPIENFYSTMNLLGNHDTERILTVLNGNLRLLEFIVAIQMCMPGTPLIYYGDEVGVTGYTDPDNRKPYPWGRENKNIYDMYIKLIRLRKNNEALVNGDFYMEEESNGLVVIRRCYNKSNMFIILNNSDVEKSIEIKINSDSKLIDVITGEEVINIKENMYSIITKEKYYRILQKV